MRGVRYPRPLIWLFAAAMLAVVACGGTETVTETVIQTVIVEREVQVAGQTIIDDELQAISLHAWFASGIHPYVRRINNPPKVCNAAGASDIIVKVATEALYECFGIADERLAGREYFFDHFTTPDAHFFWCYRRSTQVGVDLSGFHNVMEHFKRMQERPSVKKLLAYEKGVQEGFAN